MAATPEAKVKKKIRDILNEYGVYHVMPATHGYGSSGVPDILVCASGKFVGIECKANGGKPTELQKKNLADIVKAGGYSFLVDETSYGVFKMVFGELVNSNVSYPPTIYDLCRDQNQQTAQQDA